MVRPTQKVPRGTKTSLIYMLWCVEYLYAGADFIETNTFNGTAVSQSDCATQHLVSIMSFTSYMYVSVCGCYFQVKRINKVSAELAKKACKDVELETGSTA